MATDRKIDMRTLLTIVLACGVVGAAGEEKGKGDKETLKGTWTQVSFVKEGKARSEGEKVTATFGAQEIVIKHGEREEPPVEYTIDPSKTPKQIDLRSPSEGESLLGIYELKGKTLRLCLNKAERPATFAAEEGSDNVLIELERD
jgi:uncharacterized protein (TIGR03067 family)